MKKTLVNKIGVPAVLVVAGLGIIGCAPGQDIGRFMDNPLGTAADTMRYLQGGQMDKDDPWKGTAIVRKDIYPDGTIVFIVDADRVGYDLTWDYTDDFIDAKKYDKETKLLSENIGLIKYTLKNKKNEK